MMQQLAIFMQFMRRDYYVQMQHLSRYIINYAIIQPVVFSLLTGYFQANTYFGSSNITQNTILFSGTIVVTLLVVTFIQALDLLFDFDGERYINYQITILSPILVLIQRILFASLMAFLMVAPFYPISKLVLREYLDTSNTNWLMVMILLYFGSLCCSAYHIAAACALKNAASTDSLWKRLNAPMIDFGGMWVPWIVMYKFSPILGYLSYINPLIYVSEGLKQAIVGGSQFLSISTCIIMLMVFTVFFTAVGWYFFKKRLDCL